MQTKLMDRVSHVLNSERWDTEDFILTVLFLLYIAPDKNWKVH